ncbi:THUMP domain-containing class I SAM-dependent RNA methyltransferase [Paratissierella segnis]|jgi:putative N6-adenine-specific DNA methylase|uniref:Class I SAM-dependent RNA methyltransferase n=1 Tax=Paratissierella segnis TaxID=2763679 RepID=A0A926EWN5_9FIRM|nr:class I SAM-dependent RNA methyltransferase [Paratissierella segnis]MBC8587917.1 class I SAM-dependent RNA methyltransferase [Paratissierella segnis]
MDKIELIATTTFGLEAIAKRELLNLGYNDLKVENGKIEFKAALKDIPRTNIWMRTADRILLKMGQFKALSFEELFQNTKVLPWEEWIPEDGNFVVEGKSIDSKLFSISDCQRIVEKAIVEKLKTKYDVEWFKKTGDKYVIEVSLLKDIATLTIDTSGEGLHKRGYRNRAGDAPIKETLAAAMILLSYWNKDRVLLDPFCGSGTIPIEAAMIGKNIAPGLDRHFASEGWKIIDREYWTIARQDAFNAIDNNAKLQIMGCDIDKRSILRARDNAANLGLSDDITFFMKDMRDVDLNDEYGVIITNPPYGERVGDKEEITKLYVDFGEKFRKLKTWSIYVITSDKSFEKKYGMKADRKRKLYNGRIEVDYYQYYGPKPTKNI